MSVNESSTMSPVQDQVASLTDLGRAPSWPIQVVMALAISNSMDLVLEGNPVRCPFFVIGLNLGRPLCNRLGGGESILLGSCGLESGGDSSGLSQGETVDTRGQSCDREAHLVGLRIG